MDQGALYGRFGSRRENEWRGARQVFASAFSLLGPSWSLFTHSGRMAVYTQLVGAFKRETLLLIGWTQWIAFADGSSSCARVRSVGWPPICFVWLRFQLNWKSVAMFYCSFWWKNPSVFCVALYKVNAYEIEREIMLCDVCDTKRIGWVAASHDFTVTYPESGYPALMPLHVFRRSGSPVLT